MAFDDYPSKWNCLVCHAKTNEIYVNIPMIPMRSNEMGTVIRVAILVSMRIAYRIESVTKSYEWKQFFLIHKAQAFLMLTTIRCVYIDRFEND